MFKLTNAKYCSFILKKIDRILTEELPAELPVLKRGWRRRRRRRGIGRRRRRENERHEQMFENCKKYVLSAYRFRFTLISSLKTTIITNI